MKQTVPDLSWYTPAIEAVQSFHRARVASLFAGQPPKDIVAISGQWYGHSHGLAGNNEIDMLADPEDWLADVLTDMAACAPANAADRVTFRPQAIEADALGVHFIDALFGAQVRFYQGQIWNAELEIDLADLEPPDLDSCAVMRKALRLVELCVQASQGKLLVAAPVLSCAVNIAINLFGERILEALQTRPETARRVLGIINQTILEAMARFAAVIPEEIRRCSVCEDRYMPPGFGFVDGCATQLVSLRHYREYFLPLDQHALRTAPRGGMIHLCGAHSHLISTFASLPELRAVQINDRAVEDLEAFHRDLRPDQILYVAPSAAFPIERILKITQGRRLVLQAVLAEPVQVSTL